MLAVIGLYGVTDWLVVQGTREIGIRMALGAQAHNVLVLALRQGMKLVLIGALIGIPASLAAVRLLSSMLIGLTTSDALTIGVVTALLVGVTLLACYLPSRRATRVDPLKTLRYEHTSLRFTMEKDFLGEDQVVMYRGAWLQGSPGKPAVLLCSGKPSSAPSTTQGRPGDIAWDMAENPPTRYVRDAVEWKVA